MLASGRACSRYRNWAARCRQSASETDDAISKTGLLRMAADYDRRAALLNTPGSAPGCLPFNLIIIDRPKPLRAPSRPSRPAPNSDTKRHGLRASERIRSHFFRRALAVQIVLPARVHFSLAINHPKAFSGLVAASGRSRRGRNGWKADIRVCGLPKSFRSLNDPLSCRMQISTRLSFKHCVDREYWKAPACV